MADQAKLLVTALQSKSSVKYKQIKVNAVRGVSLYLVLVGLRKLLIGGFHVG